MLKKDIKVKDFFLLLKIVGFLELFNKQFLQMKGMGTLKCYGDSTFSENGTFSCSPAAPWAAYAPPQVVSKRNIFGWCFICLVGWFVFSILTQMQGLVADGEDRSHWVIVDDRG